MKCSHYAPMVATVQIYHPWISTKDEVCAECLVFWERMAAAAPGLGVLIEPIQEPVLHTVVKALAFVGFAICLLAIPA